MSFPDSSFARAGKYSHIRLIAQSACGKVYRAEDNLGRVVAVKEVLATAPFGCQERFLKEARTHASLFHPNIVSVYGLEQEPQTSDRYLVCAFADLGSLEDYMRLHSQLSESLALAIALDICAALAHVAERRYVHRDVKPANIMLFQGDQGRITAKLNDFGVVKDLDALRAGRPTTLHGGSHAGTPEYMAPEQSSQTNPVDGRTDIYALGIVLWEMLTGIDFQRARASGPLDLHKVRSQASPDLSTIIGRALMPDPADRYPSAAAMAVDLQAVRNGSSLVATPTLPLGRPVRRMQPRRRLVAAVGIALVLTLAFGALSLRATAPLSYARECEQPDEVTVGRQVARAQAQGGAVHGQFGTIPSWPAQPGFVAYKGLALSRSGHWYLRLRYSKHSPTTVPILISLNDEPEPRAAFHPLDQQSWESFVWSDAIDLGWLEAGTYTLRLATVGQAYGVADLDAFELTTVRP